MEPPLVSRRNPSRAGRDSSLKALEQFQFHTVVLTPTTRKQALASPQSLEWLRAEKEELASIQQHSVWKLVPRTSSMHVLGCRFVYKLKRDPATQEIKRFKARLVAQGYRQREGVDYNLTFASTVNMQSLRLFFFLVSFYKFFLYKVDIKTFFLHGDLLETIYMEQPKGYVDSTRSDHVCKLSKSLYGTKQAMRCANSKLNEKLATLGIEPFKSDPHVYLKRYGSDVLLICVYVDDIGVASNNKKVLGDFVAKLKEFFSVVVIEDPVDYLGMQICRNREEKYFKLHQQGQLR